jgi:hypothetical protein
MKKYDFRIGFSERPLPDDITFSYRIDVADHIAEKLTAFAGRRTLVVFETSENLSGNECHVADGLVYVSGEKYSELIKEFGEERMSEGLLPYIAKNPDVPNIENYKLKISFAGHELNEK